MFRLCTSTTEALVTHNVPATCNVPLPPTTNCELSRIVTSPDTFIMLELPITQEDCCNVGNPFGSEIVTLLPATNVYRPLTTNDPP